MKKSLTNFKNIFTYLEFGIYILLLVLLVQLGFWQIHRAAEKQKILKQYHQMSEKTPLMWQTGGIQPKAFQQVLVRGKMLKPRFYLDNQFFEHRLGYNVLFPVQLQDHSILMVDSGWVWGSTDRHAIPQVKINNQNIWMGRVYKPSTQSIHCGHFLDHQQNQIYVIEFMDFSELEKILKHPIHHWVLRLNSERGSVFQRKWPIINLAPERHQAYAVQWFTMALVVIVIFLWRVIQHAKK